MAKLFLKNEEEVRSFWEGSYKKWGSRPRFFRSAKSLYSSVNNPIPKIWSDEYHKSHPEIERPIRKNFPSDSKEYQFLYLKWADYYYKMRQNWNEYVLSNRLHPSDILEMLKAEKLVTYNLE